MDSIFTRIIKGEIPGNFIWSDEHCVVITTIQPIRAGHVLLIPKLQIDHWFDVPDDVASHMMVVAKKVAKAIKAAYPCERIGMIIAGLEVPHTHLHLLPIDGMGDFNFANANFADADELKKVAENIKEWLGS
jgi:diadenosine tetraphosphate (Ap4A) HIT family hydrolase